jgi:anti-sigma B factor antagonist
MSLRINDNQVQGVSVLELDGRIVFGEEAAVLRDKVKSMIDAGNRQLVLNVSKVTFIDSAGLGALVSAHHVTASHGGTLRLCNVGSKFKEMLLMTKMYTVFQISETEVDAIRSFPK